MAWTEKEKPTPFDARPVTGLTYLDGDQLVHSGGPEWMGGQKYPVVVFPSGAEFPIWQSLDPEVGPKVQLFGLMDLPLRHSRDRAYDWAREIVEAARERLPEGHYRVQKVAADSLELWGEEQTEHFLVTYDDAAGEMLDVVPLEDDLVRYGVAQLGDVGSGVPPSKTEPAAAEARQSRYADEDHFAPVVRWLEPLVAHILWQTKTVAGYIPPYLIADAMQEGFLKLWQRLHDEPGFIEANTKSYVAQWIAWRGADRLLYGNGHKRWAKYTLSADALQQHVQASGAVDGETNDKLDMMTDAVDTADFGNLFTGEVNGYAQANGGRQRYPLWTLAVENRIDLERAVSTLAERYLAEGDDGKLFALVAVTTTATGKALAQVWGKDDSTLRRRVKQVRAELRVLLVPQPSPALAPADAPPEEDFGFDQQHDVRPEPRPAPDGGMVTPGHPPHEPASVTEQMLYQIDMFSGEYVDNRTRAQKRRAKEREQPQPVELFPVREVFQFGVSATSMMRLPVGHLPLLLEHEDPRTEEEIEADRERAAEERTHRMFEGRPELYGAGDQGDEQASSVEPADNIKVTCPWYDPICRL